MKIKNYKKFFLVFMMLLNLNGCETFKSFRNISDNIWVSEIAKFNNFKLTTIIEQKIHQLDFNEIHSLSEKEYSFYIRSHSGTKLKETTIKTIQESGLFGANNKSDLEINIKIDCTYYGSIFHLSRYFILLTAFLYMGIYEEQIEVRLEVIKNGRLHFDKKSTEKLIHHRGLILPIIPFGNNDSSLNARSASVRDQIIDLLKEL